MAGSLLKIINGSPITLADGFSLEMEFIAQSVKRVNQKFRGLKEKTERLGMNVFEIMDFRMLSGLVGEALVADIDEHHPGLEKNPNIDGYPDLMNASRPEYRRDIARWKAQKPDEFLNYVHGGIEIKNTFGEKKSKVHLAPGSPRVGKINGGLIWKAHHQYTNNLLALFSDFIDEYPQIVAVMYSDCLKKPDWTKKQNPKKNSTMTSFTAIKSSGREKLMSGLRHCRNDPRYLSFFGQEVSQ